MEIWLFNLQHVSVLKAQPWQHISYIYIYLYVSYQSVYTGSKLELKTDNNFLLHPLFV